jgi:D-inositol-3-phosphate glycosyltransferase
LAGQGETENLCRDLAQQLGCRNVTFLGHLSSVKLGEEMRHADVFFFPSILEGNPQVLLQASACGLPCVAMNVYHSDYVVDGKTGFLVRSDIELSERLDQLLADPVLRQQFGEAAVAHVRRFDWNDIAKQWATVFENSVATQQEQKQLQAC